MCNYQIEQAFQHVRGELPAHQAGAFREHLTSCADCDLRVRQAVQVRRLSIEAADDVPTIDWRRVRSGVHDAMAARRRPLLPALLVPLTTAAVAALVLLVLPQEQTSSPVTEAPRVESTFVETSREVALADGSTLTMPSGAEVQLLANGAERVAVRLVSGSVTAEVVKSTSRTEFLVQAGATEVRVLGTRFTVTLENGRDAVVSVEHGLVLVKDGEGVVAELAAGQQKRFAAVAESARAQESARSGSAGAVVEPPLPIAEASADRAPEGTAPLAANRRELEEVAVAEPQARRQPVEARTAEARPVRRPEAHVRPAERSAAPAPEVRPAPETAAAVELAYAAPRVEMPPVETEIVAVGSGETVVEVTSVTAEPLFNTGRAGVVAMVAAARDGRCDAVTPMIERFLATNRGHRNYSDVLYIQGYCQVVRGQRERGLRTWKRYEALDPHGPWLRSVGDWTDPAVPDPALVR